MTPVEPLSLGLIGAGGFARFVLSAVSDLPDVRLVAVTDADPDRARRLAGGYGADVTGDAAAMLERDQVEAVIIATPPRTHAELAIGGRRPDGRTDTVVCTVEHVDGALASHAHGFSHSRRAERQLMRLDFGLAEARVHGWIPLRADLDVWADDDVADSYAQLPVRAAEMLGVPGARPSGYERISVIVERDAAPAVTHARDIAYRAPHRVTACLEVSGPNAKDRVYRESVRAALRDLATSARTGSTPRANITAGHAAVRLAAAATAALHDGTTHRLASSEAS